MFRCYDAPMTFSDAISVVVLSIFFFFCGALFIFKTKMLVEWGQKNREKYLVIRKYFHVPDMTMNPRLSQEVWHSYTSSRKPAG